MKSKENVSLAALLIMLLHTLDAGIAIGRGARMVRTVLGNYTPQTDPHRKALDSNIGTKKTARKWILLRL